MELIESLQTIEKLLRHQKYFFVLPDIAISLAMIFSKLHVIDQQSACEIMKIKVKTIATFC
jgi:hypothetical protein